MSQSNNSNKKRISFAELLNDKRFLLVISFIISFVLWMWVFDEINQSRLFKLFDARSVSDFAWSGVAYCDMDFGSAGNFRLFYTDYAVFLLFYWNFFGKNMGNIFV